MADPRERSPQNPCDSLAAYELGLLESKEKSLFEDHLESCTACLESLYEMAPYASVLRTEARHLAARLELDRSRTGEPAGPEVQPKGARLRRGIFGLRQWAISFGELLPRRAWVPVAGAVVVALALIAILFYPEQGGTLRSLARIEPVPYIQMERRGTAPRGPAQWFDEGMERYTKRDYPQAARLLAQAVREGEVGGWGELDQARFFLGLSLLLAGNPEEAQIPLAQASTSRLQVLSDRARWYRAQACLLSGDAEGARAELKALVKGGLVYASGAQGQLEAVDRILKSRELPGTGN